MKRFELQPRGKFNCVASIAIVCILAVITLNSQHAQVKQRELYKSDYRIIDIHTHGPVPGEKPAQACFEIMESIGFDAATILLFDSAGWDYQGGWSESKLLAWLELRKKYPERLIIFGTVDFGRAAKEEDFFLNIVVELERHATRGMQGIKIWKNLGMHHRDSTGKLLKIDDPRLDPFWAKCGELGLPVFIHTADPKEYWYPRTYKTFQYHSKDTSRYYKHADVPEWDELIRQRDNVLRKHPRTTFIGAHFGSLSSDFDRLAKTLDTYPNFYAESGARSRFFYRYHPQAVHDFFVKYQDRLLFGTDTFLPSHRELDDVEKMQRWKKGRIQSYGRYLEYFETNHDVELRIPGSDNHSIRLSLTGVKLPPAVLEKFYHGNAERLIPGFRKLK